MLSRLFFLWEQYLARRDTNRIVRPFEWGLEFVCDGSPVDNPKAWLLDYAKRAIAESDAYYSYPPVKEWRLDGDHLTFSTPLPSMYPKNNTVHGRYFPVDSGGRVVVVLPQWNADAQGHGSLCRMLNFFGLSALRLSLPYHDLRMPEELVRADYMLSPNLGRTLQAVRQAVIEARAALDWLEMQGYTKFAILGTSIGSCVALIANAHDPRLALSVQNHISPYFADVVWKGISTRHVRQKPGGKYFLAGTAGYLDADQSEGAFQETVGDRQEDPAGSRAVRLYISRGFIEGGFAGFQGPSGCPIPPSLCVAVTTLREYSRSA